MNLSRRGFILVRSMNWSRRLYKSW